MPRTTALTPELAAAIIALVEKGLHPAAAGEALGVSRATVNEWIRRGEGRDDRSEGEPYATFATETRAAEARVLARVVEAWTGAALAGDWRAGMAWAARRFPDEWGDKPRPQVEGGELITLQRLAEMMDVGE